MNYTYKAHASEPEYRMHLPEGLIYKDVNMDTVLTLDSINSYLNSNNKRFEKKYNDLYHEG